MNLKGASMVQNKFALKSYRSKQRGVQLNKNQMDIDLTEFEVINSGGITDDAAEWTSDDDQRTPTPVAEQTIISSDQESAAIEDLENPTMLTKCQIFSLFMLTEVICTFQLVYETVKFLLALVGIFINVTSFIYCMINVPLYFGAFVSALMLAALFAVNGLLMFNTIDYAAETKDRICVLWNPESEVCQCSTKTVVVELARTKVNSGVVGDQGQRITGTVEPTTMNSELPNESKTEKKPSKDLKETKLDCKSKKTD